MPYRRVVLVLIPMLVIVGAGLLYLRATSAASSGAIVATLDQTTVISAAPGRVDAENTFIVGGIPATGLRLLSRSLDMGMGITAYAATPLGAGRWQVTGVEAPMVGRWGIEVQARRHQSWVRVGNITYDVPFAGQMHLVRAQ